MTGTQSTRISSFGSFELPIDPARAFLLFTAEGERDWVPGWSPDILGDLPQHPGLVFLTSVDGQQTIWTVLKSDAGKLRHRYSRVTPGVAAGIVEVELLPTPSGSRVGVRYDMTVLSPAGEAFLASHSGDAFAQMLGKWRELIMAAIGSDHLEPA